MVKVIAKLVDEDIKYKVTLPIARSLDWEETEGKCNANQLRYFLQAEIPEYFNVISTKEESETLIKNMV